MKKILYFLFLLLFEFQFAAYATKPFRFVLLTDLHISSTNLQPTEDLQNAINDVSKLSGIDFAIVSGDVADRGDTVSLRMAQQMLQKLNMPYYIIPGNHDVKWYESGADNFNYVFKDTKFAFTHNDVEFVGFTTAGFAVTFAFSTEEENGAFWDVDTEALTGSLTATFTGSFTVAFVCTFDACCAFILLGAVLFSAVINFGTYLTYCDGTSRLNILTSSENNLLFSFMLKSHNDLCFLPFLVGISCLF